MDAPSFKHSVWLPALILAAYLLVYFVSRGQADLWLFVLLAAVVPACLHPYMRTHRLKEVGVEETYISAVLLARGRGRFHGILVWTLIAMVLAYMYSSYVFTSKGGNFEDASVQDKAAFTMGSLVVMLSAIGIWHWLNAKRRLAESRINDIHAADCRDAIMRITLLMSRCGQRDVQAERDGGGGTGSKVAGEIKGLDSAAAEFVERALRGSADELLELWVQHPAIASRMASMLLSALPDGGDAEPLLGTNVNASSVRMRLLLMLLEIPPEKIAEMGDLRGLRWGSDPADAAMVRKLLVHCGSDTRASVMSAFCEMSISAVRQVARSPEAEAVLRQLMEQSTDRVVRRCAKYFLLMRTPLYYVLVFLWGSRMSAADPLPYEIAAGRRKALLKEGVLG